MTTRPPRELPPSASDVEAADVTPTFATKTIAQVKLRRFVDRLGIAEAVRRTGIKRATLLALRLGTLADPKCSQILSLERHAGISLHDWVTDAKELVVQEVGRDPR